MKQHRVPESYWNSFCYLKGTARKLSIYKKGDKFTSSTTVKSFTAESDIFNIPYLNENAVELENAFRDIENDYQDVICKLNKNIPLSDIDKHTLIGFLSSLLCRSKPTSEFISKYLNDNRDKLIEDIIITFKDKEIFREILKKCEYDINVVRGVYMIHFHNIISEYFAGTILISAKSKYWLTTDNPVLWDFNDNYDYLITPETAFYLPLNSKYCLYLYHRKSKGNKLIEDLDFNSSLYECDDLTHDVVMNKLLENDFEYMVSPVNLRRSDLTSR